MRHLVGRRLPDVDLPANAGSPVEIGRIAGTAVIFCYPFTERPGHADPPNWGLIPGARGSTERARAYAQFYGEFRRLGAKVFGVSLQTVEWQQEFITRNAIPFRLLSDQARRFSGKLYLPLFATGGVDYLQPLTLIAQDGVIAHLIHPVIEPERDASDVLALISAKPVSRGRP
jgi:peroxiredoxin